jgi:regulatory protein
MSPVRRPGRSPLDPDKAASPEAARVAAVAQLARRDFASGELQGKLGEKGFAPEAVAAVIADLVAEGVLNDERYAANYVAYHAGRGQGPQRIRQDLRSLGVDAALIESALESGPDFRVLARQVRVRKFGSERPEAWSEKARQARFLQYRGFSSDHIRFAIGSDFDPEE